MIIIVIIKLKIIKIAIMKLYSMMGSKELTNYKWLLKLSQIKCFKTFMK